MSETRRRLMDEFLKTTEMDTSSPENGAVFFSGPKAKRLAKKMSKNGDFVNVTQTQALTEFNKWQRHCYGDDGFISIQDYYAVGDWISEKFANEATGVVTVCLDGIKPHGTFARAEIPALFMNDNVTHFVVYDYAGADGKPEPVEMSKSDFADYVNAKLAGMKDRRLESPDVRQVAPALV